MACERPGKTKDVKLQPTSARRINDFRHALEVCAGGGFAVRSQATSLESFWQPRENSSVGRDMRRSPEKADIVAMPPAVVCAGRSRLPKSPPMNHLRLPRYSHSPPSRETSCGEPAPRPVSFPRVTRVPLRHYGAVPPDGRAQIGRETARSSRNAECGVFPWDVRHSIIDVAPIAKESRR